MKCSKFTEVAKTPYRPSANGQVERFNRTIMDAVQCFVSKSQDNWDEHLPQIAGAIRSSVNRNTGFTPKKLMLGREVTLPADLVFRPSNTDEDMNLDDYFTRLQESIRLSHEVAIYVLKTSKLMQREIMMLSFTLEHTKQVILYMSWIQQR